MVNEQLLDFIRQQQKAGISTEIITTTLTSHGWKTEQIQEVFAVLKPKKKHRGCLIAIISTVAVVIFLISGLPFVLNFFAKDIPLVQDEDLKLEATIISDDQNSFTDVLSMKSVVFDVSKILDTYKKTNTWHDDEVQYALDKNGKTFEIIEKIVSKPTYQYFASEDAAKKINPLEMLKAGRALELKSLQLLHKEKDNEALVQALQSADVGQKLMAYQPALTEYLVGIALKSGGLSAAQRILSGNKLTTDILKQSMARLEGYTQTTDGLINALKNEYSLVSSNIIAEMPKSGQQNKYLFQPNKTKQMMAQFYRLAISDSQAPCSMVKDNKNTPAAIKPSVFMALTENSIGNVLTNTFIRSINMSTQLEKRCNDLVIVSATQTLFAIKSYKMDTGKLPEGINDLVPKYLHAIPEDPYSGDSMRYNAVKKIVYSVGLKGIDDGGSEGEEWTKMPNPTFRINF